jgi:hypothetical protein
MRACNNVNWGEMMGPDIVMIISPFSFFVSFIIHFSPYYNHNHTHFGFELIQVYFALFYWHFNELCSTFGRNGVFCV